MKKRGKSDPVVSAYFSRLVNAFDGQGKDFARLSGLPASAVSQLKAGTYGAGPTTVRGIARWQKLSPDAVTADARAWDSAGRPKEWNPPSATLPAVLAAFPDRWPEAARIVAEDRAAEGLLPAVGWFAWLETYTLHLRAIVSEGQAMTDTSVRKAHAVEALDGGPSRDRRGTRGSAEPAGKRSAPLGKAR